MNITLEHIQLGFTIITTVSTLYLSYIALVHTAKPRIVINLKNDRSILCGDEINFKFCVQNIGHWYAKPMAINLIVYCNFSKELELKKMFFGSIQQQVDDIIKKGVGDMNYFEASGLKVGKGKDGEEIHVIAQTPEKPGTYFIRVDAYSDNGVSYRKYFSLTCHAKQSE